MMDRENLKKAAAVAVVVVAATAIGIAYHNQKKKEEEEGGEENVMLWKLKKIMERVVGGRRRRKRKVRVYMDGCFDMMHYGHCNALRQARALGDELVVGVVSDEEIIANKGPPVTPLHERLIMVSAVKWVDQVIPDAPYAITQQFMTKLFHDYHVDYIIHGDDPCFLPDGSDAYALAKKAGRFKQIKRTEGVSSTDIVGRMLLCTRDHHTNTRSDAHPTTPSSLQRQFSHGHAPNNFQDPTSTRVSHFLPTSRRIVQFSNGKVPTLLLPPPSSSVPHFSLLFDFLF